MEAACLNPLVVLGSLVPNVYLAVVSKRGLHIPFPGGSQDSKAGITQGPGPAHTMVQSFGMQQSTFCETLSRKSSPGSTEVEGM